MTRALALLLCATGIGLVGFALWSLLGGPEEIAPLAPEARPLEQRQREEAPPPSAPLESLPFNAPPLSRPGGTTYPDRSAGPEGLMVVDPEGNPIPGAVVALCDRWDTAGPRVRHRDHCDDRGILELDAERLHYPILFCTHEGAAGWILHKELQPQPKGPGEPPRRSPTLALRRHTRVVVTVIDEGGAPLAGDRVWLRAEGPRIPGRDIYSRWPTHRTGVTDTRGIAVFGIDPIDPYFGRARHFTAKLTGQGSRSRTRSAYDPEGDVRIDIVVPASPRVLFRAVDGSGRERDLDFAILYRGETDGLENLEGHLVLNRGEAILRTPRAFDRVRAVPFHSVSADLFVAPSPTPVVYRAWGQRGQRLHRSPPRVRIPDQPDPWVVPVVFDDLPPVITVPIRTPSGGIAAGRELGILVDGEALHELRLDEQGRFHVLGDRARNMVLRPRDRRRCWFGETRLELPETERDLHLDPVVLESASLLAAGRVAEEDGRPVSGARLTAHWDGAVSEGRSAADGSFEIVGERLMTGKIELRVTTTNPRRNSSRQIEAGVRNLLVELPALGDIEGSVDPASFPDLPFIRIAVDHHAQGLVETDWGSFRQPLASGRFRIEKLPAGTLDLIIETASGRRVTISAVEIIAGETTRDPRLQKLDLTDEAAFRRIEVVAPGGTPIPQAIVIWSAPDGGSGNTLLEMETDENGVALIAEHPGPPGLVVAEGYQDEMAALFAPIPPIRVTLQPATPCLLRIPDELARTTAAGDHGSIMLNLTPHPPSCPPALLRGLPSRDLPLDGQPTQTLRLSPGRYRATLVRRAGRNTRRADLGAYVVGPEPLRVGISLAIESAALAEFLQ